MKNNCNFDKTKQFSGGVLFSNLCPEINEDIDIIKCIPTQIFEPKKQEIKWEPFTKFDPNSCEKEEILQEMFDFRDKLSTPSTKRKIVPTNIPIKIMDEIIKVCLLFILFFLICL